MPIEVTDGILIPTEFAFPTTLESALPKPQIRIQRSPQLEDAWCYAACAEMVINFCRPEALVNQCMVASFAKDAKCCDSTISVCTDEGCDEDQIAPIFGNFGLDCDGFDPNHPDESTEIGPISMVEIMADLFAVPPRPIEAVIEWRVGPGQGSSHAVLIVGVKEGSVCLIDPLPGGTYDGWQPLDHFQNGFGHGRWARTWTGLKRRI